MFCEDFFYIRDHSMSNSKSRDIACQIYEELEGIYGKVPVLMVKKQNGIDKILKLHKNWSGIRTSKKLGSKAAAENLKICNSLS